MKVWPRWHPDEVAFVREMTAMRFYAHEIARLLDRTEAAVSDKRYRKRFKMPPAPKPEAHPSPPRYRVSDIKKTVARHFGVGTDRLSSRDRSFARPRHVAMFLARDVAKRSFPDIGRMFDRDHTTAIYGVRSIAKEVAQDNDLAAQINRIRDELKPVEIPALALVSQAQGEA